MGFSTENRLESTSWIDRWLSAAAEMDEADQARPPRLMQQPTGLGGRSLQSVRLKGIQLNSYSAESRSSASSALHGKTNDHDQEPGASRRGTGREVPRLSCPTGASASTLGQLIAAATAMNAALTSATAAGSAALALSSLDGGGHGLGR